MISAIETQILQSKVIERIQQVQQQHPDLQQQYFAAQLNKEQRKNMQKINDSKEISHIELSGEEEKERKQRQGKRKANETESSNEELGQEDPHRHIDIKV